MSFTTYFRLSSYLMIAVATLALLVAGGLSPLIVAGFLAFLVLAWKLEKTKWQLSERAGLIVVLLSIPLFFVDWQIQKSLGEARDGLGVAALAHMIVYLTAIKLLQRKSDRDWVFLYLITFFEVLLAAGLSFSPFFLLSLSCYLLCGLSTVIAFEIRKARRVIKGGETRLLVPPDSPLFQRLAEGRGRRSSEARRLPFVAAALLLLIFVLALPLFLLAPRAGSAALSRSGGGLGNFIGFSESVTLGEIGTLKANNDVVMHVRIDEGQPPRERGWRWRGVALDEFSGKGWRKSVVARRVEHKNSDGGFFKLGTTESLHHLTTQTVFLEPLESPILFAAQRAVAVQGDFPYLRVDAEGSLQSRRHDFDRIIYKAFSDTAEPDPDLLRRDKEAYTEAYDRYLRLPFLDPRIFELARNVVTQAHAQNRYDAARAIESYLQGFDYSLEMKASGPDPLADFLFNVRSGHCEYFSTAMAVMLRTQGVAARVVNGFLPGEYNAAAGAFTVRQSDAHSWVEVYFPETNTWVTFDPTPTAGKVEPQTSGIAAQLGKYAEALELIWFQYVIGYDKQEQRSLANALHNTLVHSWHSIWSSLKAGFSAIPTPRVLARLILVAGVLGLLWFLARWLRLFGWQRTAKERNPEIGSPSVVQFYERLTAVLAAQGIRRAAYETPLEFAHATGSPMAVRITDAYHRVRFGAQHLSASEIAEIDAWLKQMEHPQSFSDV